MSDDLHGLDRAAQIERVLAQLQGLNSLAGAMVIAEIALALEGDDPPTTKLGKIRRIVEVIL